MLQKPVQRNKNHSKSLRKVCMLVNKSTKGSASPVIWLQQTAEFQPRCPPWLPVLLMAPPEKNTTGQGRPASFTAAHLRGHKGQNKKPLLQNDDFPLRHEGPNTTSEPEGCPRLGADERCLC